MCHLIPDWKLENIRSPAIEYTHTEMTSRIVAGHNRDAGSKIHIAPQSSVECIRDRSYCDENVRKMPSNRMRSFVTVTMMRLEPEQWPHSLQFSANILLRTATFNWICANATECNVIWKGLPIFGIDNIGNLFASISHGTPCTCNYTWHARTASLYRPTLHCNLPIIG